MLGLSADCGHGQHSGPLSPAGIELQISPGASLVDVGGHRKPRGTSGERKASSAAINISIGVAVSPQLQQCGQMRQIKGLKFLQDNMQGRLTVDKWAAIIGWFRPNRVKAVD